VPLFAGEKARKRGSPLNLLVRGLSGWWAIQGLNL
jgi:hypothetical protein